MLSVSMHDMLYENCAIIYFFYKEIVGENLMVISL